MLRRGLVAILYVMSQILLLRATTDTSSGATVSHLATLPGWRVGMELQSMLATMPMNFANWNTFSDRHPAANM